MMSWLLHEVAIARDWDRETTAIINKDKES